MKMKPKTQKPKKKTSKGQKTGKSVAVVKSSQPQTFPLAMDATSVIEFSEVQNLQYSKEIISKARRGFNLNRLKQLKENDDYDGLMLEGEKQVKGLWHSIEALNTHNTLFVVQFLIAIGEILNEVKGKLNLHQFTKWRRDVFGHQHERYLQQSQQLADMGDFAKVYAAMGKKRLLALDSLRKELGSDTCQAIFDEHRPPGEISASAKVLRSLLRENPIPDMTTDLNGLLLKEHTDGIINYHRFKKEGIDFIRFDQAALIAAYEKDALGVRSIKKIKRWLEDDSRADKKEEWFDILIMDKLQFPQEGEGPLRSDESLFKVLLDFVDYCRNHEEGLNDQDWIDTQKRTLNQEILREANDFIKKLARKCGFRLTDAR